MRLRHWILLFFFVADLILLFLAEYYQQAGDYQLAYQLGSCGFVFLFILFVAILVLLGAAIENAGAHARDTIGV